MAKDHQYLGTELVSPESLSQDSVDWLEIEQPDWPEEPSGGFLGWIQQTGKGLSLETISEYFGQYKSHCSDDGSLEVEIWVHKSRPDLVYSMNTSFGELSERFVHTGDHQKSYTIEGESSINLNLQIVGGFSAEWEGPVFGEDLGQIEPKPEIMRTTRGFEWSRKVTGVLRLKFTEEHDAFILTIIPREEGEFESGDPNGAYQSTVFAVWAEGIVSHEVDLPDMDGYCGGGQMASVNPDDPEKPHNQCYDLYRVWHKCTGEKLDERKVFRECPAEENTGG